MEKSGNLFRKIISKILHPIQLEVSIMNMRNNKEFILLNKLFNNKILKSLLKILNINKLLKVWTTLHKNSKKVSY